MPSYKLVNSCQFLIPSYFTEKTQRIPVSCTSGRWTGITDLLLKSVIKAPVLPRSGGPVHNLQLDEATDQLGIPTLPYHIWTIENAPDWCHFFRIEDDYLLRFPNLADFKINANTLAVRCQPVPNVPIATIKQLYLNQVVPLVQSRSSKLVFHGAAIVAKESAIAFVGVSGRGKSTLAASFGSNNYPFLTDDGLLIKKLDDTYHVVPSHASVRLWDDSQLAILGSEAEFETPLDYTSKLRFPANERMVHLQKPCKLHRIYFLGDAVTGNIIITRLSHQKALLALINNSFLLDIEDKKILTEHFQQLSKLSALGIFYQLDYPRNYEELANVRQAILDHAGLAD